MIYEYLLLRLRSEVGLWYTIHYIHKMAQNLSDVAQAARNQLHDKNDHSSWASSGHAKKAEN